MGFVINITGLKSLNSFIGLQDTPIYYDNGKFFKVEDNKIVYSDIKWSDIVGDISDSKNFEDVINSVKDKIVKEESFVKKNELLIELEKKQPVGDYSTKLEVMQAIASIPQFKISLLNELPTTGEKMVLYLIPKEGSDSDVHNEYVWIEETSRFEFIGTTAVNLTDYVKNTDYATSSKGGVVKVNANQGISAFSGGDLCVVGANSTEITEKTQNYKPITPKRLDEAVKVGITTNTLNLTEEEKTNVCSWLGTIKIIPISQADYDALETKEPHTLYITEE